jgi:hypothetical protein
MELYDTGTSIPMHAHLPLVHFNYLTLLDLESSFFDRLSHITNK